ncbi:MAG: hypothetical protein ACTS8S_21080 [Giesbergeria sp.]
MNPSATKAEWDAPKNGDFARYVERMTAAHAVTLPEEPGRVPHVGEMMVRAKPVGADKGLPDLQALKAPTVAILSSVQLGFFLLAVAQLALLALAGLGSPFGVAAAVLAWWLVGRWKSVLRGPRQPGSSPKNSLVALQRELQALAQQRSNQASRK